MSIPVVIAENGLGAPVIAVEANAPSAVVAENGLGTPIVLVETNGAPFVVQGLPVYPQSFTMVAGTVDTGDFGYSVGVVGNEAGSIDREPIPDSGLVVLVTGSQNLVAFPDDDAVLELLTGKSLYVDGIEYPFTIDWAAGGGYVQAGWTTGAPVFADSESYLIEIK